MIVFIVLIKNILHSVATWHEVSSKKYVLSEITHVLNSCQVYIECSIVILINTIKIVIIMQQCKDMCKRIW
jgi:hypothetical protein